MKKNFLKTIVIVTVTVLCGIGTLSAQEQTDKKVAYNFINEYGFFVGRHVGWTGVFVNGIAINQADLIGIGIGYGLNTGSFQEIPLYLNYRHYFDTGKKLKPLVNVAVGAAAHFWDEDVMVPYQTEDGYQYQMWEEQSMHGFGLYATISGGFKVKALSFTGGFFFRSFPRTQKFTGGIEAKVGYTF